MRTAAFTPNCAPILRAGVQLRMYGNNTLPHVRCLQYADWLASFVARLPHAAAHLARPRPRPPPPAAPVARQWCWPCSAQSGKTNCQRTVHVAHCNQGLWSGLQTTSDHGCLLALVQPVLHSPAGAHRAGPLASSHAAHDKGLNAAMRHAAEWVPTRKTRWLLRDWLAEEFLANTLDRWCALQHSPPYQRHMRPQRLPTRPKP